MALGQPHDCPSASEVIFKGVYEIYGFLIITKHKKAQTAYIFIGTQYEISKRHHAATINQSLKCIDNMRSVIPEAGIKGRDK